MRQALTTWLIFYIMKMRPYKSEETMVSPKFSWLLKGRGRNSGQGALAAKQYLCSAGPKSPLRVHCLQVAGLHGKQRQACNDASPGYVCSYCLVVEGTGIMHALHTSAKTTISVNFTEIQRSKEIPLLIQGEAHHWAGTSPVLLDQ